MHFFELGLVSVWVSHPLGEWVLNLNSCFKEKKVHAANDYYL